MNTVEKMKFNLPVLISEWTINYKPLPLMRPRKIKHYLGTNLLEEITSFTENTFEAYREPKYPYTLPIDTAYDIQKNGFDILKVHYMYKKKSWSVPEIDMAAKFLVYLPYHVIKKGPNYYLFEETSGLKKRLKTEDKIYKIIIGDEAV